MSHPNELEMEIHKVKDRIGNMSSRVDRLEKQIQELYTTTFEIKTLIDDLRSKL